jgi:hypothetical protein
MKWFVRFQYKEVHVLPSYIPNLDEAEAVVIVDGLRGGVRPVHPVEGEGLGREVGLTRVQDTAGQRSWVHANHALHRKKKVHEFPVSSRDVTYQTPPGQEYFSYDVIIPAQREFGSDIPAGDGKLRNLFLRCKQYMYNKVFFIV